MMICDAWYVTLSENPGLLYSIRAASRTENSSERMYLPVEGDSQSRKIDFPEVEQGSSNIHSNMGGSMTPRPVTVEQRPTQSLC